jgi:hypothetical protein
VQEKDAAFFPIHTQRASSEEYTGRKGAGTLGRSPERHETLPGKVQSSM